MKLHALLFRKYVYYKSLRHLRHLPFLCVQPLYLPLQPNVDRHLDPQDARQQLRPPCLERRQLGAVTRLATAISDQSPRERTRLPASSCALCSPRW